jgi:osmoprotectant transport system permease protein
MSYILEQPAVVIKLLFDHLLMTTVALSIALVIAVPIGLLITRYRRIAPIVLGVLGALYTIPSIAVIILLLPLFGLNAKAVVVALVIYAQVILVRNITAGLAGVDCVIVEAARGLGLNARQRWWQVELPLALPVILAGVRLAALVCIAIAAIGAKFGAGGLGTLLFEGIQQAGRYDKIWAGTIAVSLLAFAVNGLLLWLEREIDPMRRVKGVADLPRP